MVISVLKIVFVALFTAIISSLVIVAAVLFRSSDRVYRLSRFHARTLLKVCGVKLNVTGLDSLKFTRNYIYIANHASLFDIPAVIAGLPDHIRFVYKKELNKIPFLGWGLKYSRVYIPIDRGRSQDALQTLERTIKKIREGDSVILFAEGTRTPDGRLQQFKRGAFNLAVKANVPVVPLTINGSYSVLSRNSMRLRPGTISITIGKPIVPPGANGKSSELQLRDEVRRVIEQHYTDQ